MIRKLYRLLTTEHLLTGVSLARIAYGLFLLFYLISHYAERHLLWGPGGLLPHDSFLEMAETRGILTLFHLSGASWFFELIYHAGFVIVFLYLVGYRTRLTGVLTFILFWSFYFRNPHLTNGGDNILRIQLFYLMFAQVGARFSLDALRRRNMPSSGEKGIAGEMSAVLHNAAVLAAVVQLAFLYFTAGMYKVMGSYWQEGTALYYAMRVQEFYWPGISEWIWKSEFLLVFLSYATVIFQVAFPFLLLNRVTKLIAVGSAILFHGGIALFMGLTGFSWIMIGSELILLTDKDYRLIGTAARRVGARAAGPFRRLGEKISALPAVQRRQMIVFYDGWCPLCRASVASSKKLDWFSLIRFVSFREPGVIQQYGLDADKAERRMHSTADGRRFAEGIDAVIQMATRLLPLWPAVPLLLLARWIGIGQRAYDFIASRRTILLTGGCGKHCSLEEGKKESVTLGE
ncbi:putative DCC family thiol-disulfide oxidoreductase YuxK [Planifilum fimeticola]|uniref:Putative DCC family thiol-disulfide oxidoreductase YuxK n=1 Tax=Planifilum fimeticola TaxID=201975 RepID=A0A2T0LDJ3_9BACL|nr:DCC1-like thiol-disulfide oxidoreductase family protein [Planifilum fimeticola]PRX40131.1 putative DCC family thiol-disulfide oxidoreductase YuxK [Planifilum fimeticola]